MPPSSGELWGHHLMPPQVKVDCLLPTGIIIVLTCNRDSILENVKAELWAKAKDYPLHSQLSDPSSYIFVSITQDAEKEEFYDETRRLCDLRLFQPILKVVEPRGNREEKMLNYDIGVAIGMPVNDFNEITDLEVMAFRRNSMTVCSQVVDELKSFDLHTRAVHAFPPDIHTTPDLPKHVQEKIADKALLICVWWLGKEGKRKYTVKVPCDSTTIDVIAEVIRVKTTKMPSVNSVYDKEAVIQNYKEKYVLKVCGSQNFLLEPILITQYKYIRKCISRQRIPQLMLLDIQAIYNNVPKPEFTLPSYVLRGQGALQHLNSQPTSSLWSIEDMLRIQVKCATHVHARDYAKLYVKAGIYHGTELLCPIKNSKYVEPSKPKWFQWLDFDLYIPDIPRSAKLCLSLCSVSKKRKNVNYAVAWGNINLFDFNGRMQTDKVSLYLWPVPQGLDDLLNPVGMPGSNYNLDSVCLELEFENYGRPVSFPDDHQIEEFAQWVAGRTIDPVHHRGSTTYTPISYLTSNSNFISDQLDDETLQEIIRRDALSEISEQEKDLLWKHRKKCLDYPTSLPKLLQALKWNSREDVALLYMLLKQWPTIPPEYAIELLNCTYADLKVRQFAVSCLSEKLKDDDLSQYLLQLVQVLKFEPYLDNPLTYFLLKRCMVNYTLGQFFFWHIKSEMHQVILRQRFGLVLEAFCRGSGPHLKTFCRQVEAIEKLTKLTDALKEEKDEESQMRVLINHVQSADYLDALQNFPSPLNPNQQLGELVVPKCDIKKSKKKPLWLVWKNPDPFNEVSQKDIRILFKNGDDLRQDMLTLQIIRIMDRIWQSEGMDLRMLPYECLSTGLNVGMIEGVPESKTVMKIQGTSLSGGIQLNSRELHKWIKDKNREEERYEMAIEAFTKSCAGYCVATFVLGIGDRHPDNIMVNEDGQVFHIDFGHFLDHRKKKFGINRERVPFVLTEDFIRVIAKDKDNPRLSAEFREFGNLCMEAYIYLRRHANLIITLFAMMLSCGIPELQSLDDVEYIRKTLQVDKTEREALDYFQNKFYDAYGGQWTTKLDWFMHYMKHK